MNDMQGLMSPLTKSPRSVATGSHTGMLTNDMGGLVETNALPLFGSDMKSRARRVVENGGFEWQRGSTTIPTTNNTNLTPLATGMGVTMFASSDRVYRTADYGRSWQTISIGASQQTKTICTDNRGRWLISCGNGTASNIYIYSLDNGLTWTQATHFGGSLFYYGSGFANGYFWLGQFNGTIVYRTSDLVNWTSHSTPANTKNRWFISDGKDRMAVGGEGFTFPYVSNNAGVSWFAGAANAIADVTPNPMVANGQVFMYPGSGTDIVVSRDFFRTTAGFTTVTMPSSAAWSRMAYSNGLYVMMVNNSTTYAMSLDGVSEWVVATRPLPSAQFYLAMDGTHVFTHFGSGGATYYADF